MRDIRDITLIEGIAYDEEKIRDLVVENKRIRSQNEELLRANDTLAHNNSILEEQNHILIEYLEGTRKGEA